MDKILIVVDLAVSASQASEIRAIVVGDSIRRVWFFPNGVTIGGTAPTAKGNSNINRVVFGHP
jgi:hypothetical protein